MGGIEIRTRRTLLPGQCARKGVSSLPVRHCELPSRRPRNLPGASRQRLEDRPYGTYPVIGGASMSFDCGHKLTSLRCNCVDYQRRNDGMAPNGGRCRADRGTESANAHLGWRRANWYLRVAYAHDWHPGLGFGLWRRSRSKIERCDRRLSLDLSCVGERFT
jgi:hypothetical protein